MMNIEKVYSDYLDLEGKKNRKKYTKYKGWFSASAAGSCYRKQLYRKNGVEETPFDDRVKRLLRLGTIVHTDIEKAIKRFVSHTDITYKVYTEHRVELPEVNVVGHLDIATQIDDKLHVYDVKTCASYKWRKKFGRNPEHGGGDNYKLQIGTYAMGLGNELEIQDVDMSLLWYNKDTSAMREETVSANWIEKSF